MNKPKYYSMLFRLVPRTKLTPRDPEFDQWKCWHCQENTRIIRKPDVIVWCQRCYNLHYMKHDGTYMQSDDRIAIGKDLVNNEENRKLFQKTMKHDTGHRIDKVIVEE